MLNEGIIVNDTAALVKSEIVNHIRRLGSTTPDDLEQAVFKALVGHGREEVDWNIEDNQAGYYSWIKSFGGFIHELIEDGYTRVEEQGALAPTEAEPSSGYSYLVYAPDPAAGVELGRRLVFGKTRQEDDEFSTEASAPVASSQTYATLQGGQDSRQPDPTLEAVSDTLPTVPENASLGHAG